MRRSPIVGRLAALTVGLVFVASFVLPCLCLADQGPSHGHCGREDSGATIAAGSCCCAGALPGSGEALAKMLPAPAAPPVAVGVLPVAFSALYSVTAAPAPRASHAPPGLLVLRI